MRELRELLVLAGPVVVSELGWMGMGLVDTAMVGRVSAEALGAVSVGSHTYFLFVMFGMGTLFGLDPVISQAWGAGRHREAHEGLVQGLHLAVVVGVLLTLVVWVASPRVGLLGVDAAVLPGARGYMDVAALGIVPLLLFVAMRRYLQAMGLVRPVMLVVLAANLLNVFANWVFVFGNLGAPALGAVGSAWATTVARVFMLLALAAVVWWIDRSRGGSLRTISWRPDRARIKTIAGLGVPAGLQMILEAGVFWAATILAAQLTPVALGAHQIALGAAAFSFMVPLAMSSAGAVRVGQTLGARDPERARSAGWLAILVGGAFMLASATTFVVVPEAIMAAFTDDPAIIGVGVGLLRIAALFQLFDGLQVVAIGVLRGAGDTRTAMVTSLFAYWVVGLPLAWSLCFVADLGVDGLWFGLTGGLVCAAAVLVGTWARRSNAWMGGGAAGVRNTG